MMADRSQEPPAPVAPANILVVDDRPGDLSVLANLLEAPEHNVVTASSGAEALRRVLEMSFAVILLDVFMPGMDGFEVATLIRQREQSRSTPIIFLTAAHHDVGAIYRAYSVGAVDYLVKPLDERVVRAKVAIFVDLHLKDQRIMEQAHALREADRRERELQLAEARLLSEKRYRALVETIPACVWTADAEGAVDYCNHRWTELTGLRLDETRGAQWLEAVHPDDHARVAREWGDAVRGGATFTTELRLRLAGGGYRWHICQAVPEQGRRDDLRGWLGMFADCEELKRAIEARDEFLSIASHELRTPLTTLLLQVEGLQRQLANASADERLQRKAALAIAQARRLDALVGSLLDVARIGAGKLVLEPEEFDLAEVARQCCDRIGEQAVRAGAPVEFVGGAAVTGRWDRQRVEQVMTNLLSNAVKYGASKPVEVRVDHAEGAARITVTDRGVGIAPEHQRRIFERFERAASVRHYGGLGMGLYITRHIVEAHGGTIAVASTPGEGSTFTVTLPLRHEAVAAAAALEVS